MEASARIFVLGSLCADFCADFCADCCARIFARISARIVVRVFLCGFLCERARIVARIFCTDLSVRDFFAGVFQTVRFYGIRGDAGARIFCSVFLLRFFRGSFHVCGGFRARIFCAIFLAQIF